jgi:2-phosphoglycerate kinase
VKTFVINHSDQSRIPFLRGILTRSLLDAGMEFEDAFELASELRDELSKTREISSDEIKSRVAKRLRKQGHEEICEAYCLPGAAPAQIRVTDSGGEVVAFSRDRHERLLQASGLKPERAEQITAMIYDQMLVAGISSISAERLGYLTYLCLEQELSAKAARRFLVWLAFVRSGRPLLLLIGGTVGTGKSTLATEIAHLLEIVRIQSTDMLREVMRMMIPGRLVPVLHESSFNAWKALPAQDLADRDPEQRVATGFVSQAELLAVPCEAVLQRAMAEGVPLILEGVHSAPALPHRVPGSGGAILVHVTLAVLKPKELKARLRGRGTEVPSRMARRYLEQFDSIWALQSFLLSEADRFDSSIVANNDMQKAIREIIRQVNYELSRHFEASAETVFASLAASGTAGKAMSDWREAVVCP